MEGVGGGSLADCDENLGAVREESLDDSEVMFRSENRELGWVDDVAAAEAIF